MKLNIEKWLLEKPAGMMFLAKFLKSSWRRLTATKTGMEIIRELENEMPRAAVVVEVTHDGGIVVYGDRVNVKIVLPLKTGPKGEAMAQELASLSLKGEHKEVYLDQKKICATANFHHLLPSEMERAIAGVQLCRKLDNLCCEQLMEDHHGKENNSRHR